MTCGFQQYELVKINCMVYLLLIKPSYVLQ